jgi:hypothetical protein
MTAVASSYEDEQDKLRAQADGSDIVVTAPKEPEVNPAIYRDVEPLLFRGFLSVGAEINDVLFVFKSLNQHEFEMLRLSGGIFGQNVPPKFWDIFLAYGVFMVDGVNILSERDRYIPKITAMFAGLSREAKQRVIRHVSEINRRANNAVVLTEAYFTESYSRFRWAQVRGMDLTSTAVTGVYGTERLGMNWAQQAWRALNYYEDRNEEIDRDWENAKFIGSCMVGKGIQKVYAQDVERRRKDHDDRLARKDKILRQVVLGESMSEKAQNQNGAVMISARTADELAEQVQKDLRGEKDWHDEVVEAQERRIKDSMQAQRSHFEVLSKAHEEAFGPKFLTSTAALSGLTPAEVQERILRSKQIEAQAAARSMVYPDLTDPKVGNFLEKWGMTATEVQTEMSQTDKDISNVVPIAPPRDPGTPFGRKK